MTHKDVETALSKVGMHLEKKLAYIHSKHKTVKDDHILMVLLPT